jgi:hypothetical protein
LTTSGNDILISRRIVSNQTSKNNTSCSKYNKNYHIIDQQYRLYQSSRCILKGVENSKIIPTTTGTTSTIAAVETPSSGSSSSTTTTTTTNDAGARLIAENKRTIKKTRFKR